MKEQKDNIISKSGGKSDVPMPTQQQIMLPLLEAVDELGGTARTKDICAFVADKIHATNEQRNAQVICKDGAHNALERQIRWTQQTAKISKLIEPAGRPFWRITGKGKQALTESCPGVVVTIFVTDKGVALWADCRDAVSYIDNGSVNLLITSPPYPLLNPRPYGNYKGNEYVEWLLRILEAYLPKLASDGSIVLNLGETYEAKGRPVVDPYQEYLLIRLREELGLRLCQRFPWNNESKLPTSNWTTKERVRAKTSVEFCYWLSASDNPAANNRKVLTPYSKTFLRTLETGKARSARRPMGYAFKEGEHLSNNGGSIPGNFFSFQNNDIHPDYERCCIEAKLPIHPARMPRQLAEFFIKFLTDKWDVVGDIFGGSGITAFEAESLDRYWFTVDAMREYVEGSRFRFPNVKMVV